MNTKLELQTVSLEFRRVSSNFLNSDYQNSSINLTRFMKYIEKTPVLHEIIHSKIDDIEFDFNKCFYFDNYGHMNISIPENEQEHLRAQYDYAWFLIHDEERTLRNDSFGYYRSISKDKVQEYISKAFKPMIDYIVDALSIKMLSIEANSTLSPSVINQTIYQSHNGTANVLGEGQIKSQNIVPIDVKEINDLLNKIISSLPEIKDIPSESIDDVKDDLESISEQILSKEPKKNRLKKSVANVKHFLKDFSKNVSVTVAANLVTEADWYALIEKIDSFIAFLS